MVFFGSCTRFAEGGVSGLLLALVGLLKIKDAGQHPPDKAEWVKLFRKKFVFTGGEITGEVLMSNG